jgi:hypothetical protein
LSRRESFFFWESKLNWGIQQQSFLWKHLLNSKWLKRYKKIKKPALLSLLTLSFLLKYEYIKWICTIFRRVCQLTISFSILSTWATYKFYWFFSILELVGGNATIPKKEKIFSRMISNSWYTVNYKMSLWQTGSNTRSCQDYFKDKRTLLSVKIRAK